MSKGSMDGKDAKARAEIARRYGVCVPRKPLWLRTSPKHIEKIEYYDSFVCKRCKKGHAFLLPKGADPCPEHVAGYCCTCCIRGLKSSYCSGKETSFVMQL